jgi:hypothetical protein
MYVYMCICIYTHTHTHTHTYRWAVHAAISDDSAKVTIALMDALVWSMRPYATGVCSLKATGVIRP